MSVNTNANNLNSSPNGIKISNVSTRVSNATRYIVTILVKYQKLNDTQLQQKEKQEILNELLNINAVELMDNFNITIDESISNDFETIYQHIVQQMNPNQSSSYSSSSCNITLCKMIQRNNRDRITKYGISNIYYNIKDDEKIVILQLLDKIHCYFMHSFDFGLKFTKSEINSIYNMSMENKDNCNNQNIDPMLNQIKQIIENKKNKIPKLSLRYDYRYVTKLIDGNVGSNMDNEERKDNESDILMQSMSSFNLFTFGKRWRYSKKYKTNPGIDKMNIGKYNQWFVSQKYTNLKREMLSNSIKKIPMQQWNQINAKSENYLKCNKAKLLKSYKNVNYEFDDSIPNIVENQTITSRHIICILIYCNFTSIKNSLIDTYNTMNKFEEWKDVKLRHSEFANFGRILTETIECFGDNIKQTKQNTNHRKNIFYHTLLGTFQLHSFQSRFFVPTSMSTQLSVIAYYYYNTINIDRYSNGLIIGFNNDLSCYFNCSFLSDFTNESEIIFAGGKNTLQFNLIYNMPKLQNYEYYISAIKLIDELFIDKTANSNLFLEIDISSINIYNAYKKCILNQIEEAHCIPSVIDYYLNGWCISRTHMNININKIINTPTIYSNIYKQLLIDCSLLLQYPPPDNIYTISIDSLCRLFPNIITIKIQSPILDIKCSLLSQIHQFLCAPQLFYGLDLLEIQLINPIVHTPNGCISNEIISSYSVAFFNSGWSIKIEYHSNNIMKNLKIIKFDSKSNLKIEHKKSKSTPTIKGNDDDPFNIKTQILNQSAGALISAENENQSINNTVNSELFENDSNLTDLSQITQNTHHTSGYTQQQQQQKNINLNFKQKNNNNRFTKVHIKMRIKKKNKSKGDIEIDFDFKNGEIPEIVANEMINELELPNTYKQEIINVINAAIPNNISLQTKNRSLRTQSHSKVPSTTNVSLVECIYPNNDIIDYISNSDNIINNNNNNNNNQNINDDNIPSQNNNNNINNNNQNIINENDNNLKIIHETGPTLKQKIQQQQTQMIVKKQVRINDQKQMSNMPNTAIIQQQSLPIQSHTDKHLDKKVNRNMSASALYNNNNNNNMNNKREDGRRRKQTVSIFDIDLILSSFDKYEFPISSVDLLQGKNAEFQAEYQSFLKTQSQIYDLKLEHIKIQNNNNITSNKFEDSHQQLARSMQEKIKAKTKELTGKWDEFVKDQKEINDLKQQISKKHLSQFKQQIHFEQQTEFIEIMNSNKININDKEIFKNKLKDFRDQMINEYQQFREQLYNKYENKLNQF